MNTNNVYYTMLRVSTKVKYEETDCTVTTITSSVGLKPVLVLVKKNIIGKFIAKDLNTNEKYSTKIPLKAGRLFVKVDMMKSLNLYEENLPTKLSKKDVLKIGNEGLEKIRERMNQKNKQKTKQKVK